MLVPAAGAGGEEQRRRPLPPWLSAAAAVLSAALAVVLYTMAWTEWREFRMPDNMNIDVAFLNQGFYRTVHGYGVLTSTIKMEGLGTILSHLSLSFFPVVPVYALWPSPLTLMLIAACAVAVFGMTAVTTAWRLFGSAPVALIWFGLFAFHPSIPWAISDDGFREVYLAMGFLSLALLFYLEKKDRLFLTILVLAMLSKEDVPLLIPVWGLVAWRQGRGARLAGALVALGVGYFLAANMIVMPLLKGMPLGHVVFVAFGSHAGNTPGEMLETVRESPGSLLQLATNPEHLKLWVALLSPLWFVPLVGWEYLVIPAYVYVEISLRSAVTIPFRHIFPALPFIFVAAMVGTARLSHAAAGLAARAAPLARRAAPVGRLSLAALLCGMIWSTLHGTSFPTALRENRPAAAELAAHVPLMKTLERIPRTASLAATLSLVGQGSSRRTLYFLGPDGYFEQAVQARPDYLALDLTDLDDRLLRLVPPLLCQGRYGVVYDDVVYDDQGTRHGRMVLALGAALSANERVYEALLPAPHQSCPAPAPQVVAPQEFRRAAAIGVRVVPSAIRSLEMFPEPVTTLSGGLLAQTIHLPDETFAPGWYRLALTGAWPWPWTAASDRLTARVLVGGRTVGEATVGGHQPLRYTTLPFRVDRPETLPVQVHAGLRMGAGRDAPAWALRPAHGGCAVIADAPSLDPQQVTVEALVYLDKIPQRSGGEVELPILSKNDALGYYLRVAGNAQKKVWVDFSVAGQWGLGQAGVGAVPLRRWTTIAATYDGREARVYIDGNPAPQDSSRSPLHAGPIQSLDAPLVIGCRDPGGSGEAVFPGRIAAAKVWNRALTPPEVHESAGLEILTQGGARGLVGSWEFRAAGAGGVPDLSGADNPIINSGQLTRVPAPELKERFAAWYSRELNVLRRVTVTVAPGAGVRERFPSELQTGDMSFEPAASSSDTRFSQIIHLPEQAFEPGRYRVDLEGAWPLPWVPAAYRVTARVFVGDHVVGQATAGGGQQLRYTTPPFTIDRRETRPVRVQVDVWIPDGPEGRSWALRPAKDGCAIVPDAPSLSPGQQVTAEALVYLDAIPKRSGREVELPILSKNNAPGYYLRLSSDDTGKVWAEFNVAGKWALARAEAGTAPLRRWMAIAATYDGQEAKIYVNGYQAPQVPHRSPRFAGPMQSQGGPLAIGCRDPNQSYEVVFPGLIASARVWNRALTLQEIREGEATWGVPSTDVTGLVGSWVFQSGEEKSDAVAVPDLSRARNAVTNGTHLIRMPMPPAGHPFSTWYSRDVKVLERVVVHSAAP